MLVIGCCFDLDPTGSSKRKWFGIRSPNSMNAPDSIFCTRLGGLVGLMNPELMLKSPGMWWAAAGAFFGLVQVH